VNRRPGSILCALAAAVVLASCGTLSADRVATVNGSDISKQSFEDYAKQQGGEIPKSGEETRQVLTQLITSKITVDADPATARAAYEQGFAGPIICLAAIAVAKPEDTQAVKDAIHAGTAMVDIAKQYASADQASVAPDGVVKSPDGAECYAPDQLNNADLKTALSGVAFGDGADFTVTAGTLVVALRRWDALSADAQKTVAAAVGKSTALPVAKVSIDSKYGRWDAASGTVVADAT
jgi:hypothetical protein